MLLADRAGRCACWSRSLPAASVLGVRQDDDQAVPAAVDAQLTAEPAGSPPLRRGRVEHLALQLLDLRQAGRPVVVDVDMAGGAVELAAALPLDAGDVLVDGG